MENEPEIIQGLWSLNYKLMYNKIIEQCPFEIGEKKKDIIWLINNYISQNPLDGYIIEPFNDYIKLYIKAGKKLYYLYFKKDRDFIFHFLPLKSISKIDIDIKDDDWVLINIWITGEKIPTYLSCLKNNKETSDFFAELI